MANPIPFAQRLPRTLLLLQGLALSLLGPAPARAVIIKAGASPAEDAVLEAKSHAAGARHKCLVRIQIRRVDTSGKGWELTGTGVYLGANGDGKAGLVLTSAHLFAAFAEAKEGQRLLVDLFLGPGGEAGTTGGSKGIPVRGALLHPHFKYPAEFKISQAGLTFETDQMFPDDLAILAFDLEAAKALVAEHGLTPAVLYDGTGYNKRPLLEAEFAGFGLFGTHTSPTCTWSSKVHAGHTLVAHGAWRGRTAFMHWSPVGPGTQAALEAKTGIPNTLQFHVLGCNVDALNPFDQTLIPIRQHPHQALAAPGDSGGPLFFNTAGNVLKVAGICSASKTENLAPALMPTLKKNSFHLNLWEPVMGHLGWIRGAMAEPWEKFQGLPLGSTTASAVETKEVAKIPQA